MALASNSIYSGRSRTSNVKNLDELLTQVNNLNSYLAQNNNYNKFVEGTDFGRKQDQKLKTIFNLVNQNLTSQTNNLINTLNRFFNNQEEINRRAAAAAAQTRAQSGNIK